MQNSQGHINARLQPQCVALTNGNTYSRGRLDDSVSLDEHRAVVDALTAAETRIALIREENGQLRKEAGENVRLLAGKDRKPEDKDRQLQDMKELKTVLEQKSRDAKSVVELLTRCIFGRSSGKPGFSAMLADAVDTVMDIHDADTSVSQLAGFASSAMAMASPEEPVSATSVPGKGAKGGCPSKKRKDGAGGETTSRNAGKKRNHDGRLKHGFETIACELDERFGISYGRYGSDMTYTVRQRHGRPGQWTVRTAFISKPRPYFQEYTVANIHSRELGDDTPDRPSRIVDGCPYSPSFAAYCLTMKFACNLSEKKIIRMLGEMGCKVRQATLNRWMHRVMKRVREAMAPVLMKEVRSSMFMHNDGTRILVRVWNKEKQKEGAFLRNGYIELENNAIERLFRHLATGRRNWTHSGSHDAAKDIAFMYSLHESCVMNDVSFGTYIEEVLGRTLAGDTNYRDMLPNRIVLAKDKQEAA